MSDPRPMPVHRLAARLHMPVSVVRQAAYDLGTHWGMERVAASYGEDGMAVTPAAIVAIRQQFGIGDIPQLRGRKPVTA